MPSVVMSNIVKDAGKKEERSKIACSIMKAEDEAHSTVHTPSMKWEEEELDLTFAPGRHMIYSYTNDEVLIHICDYKPMEEQKLLPMGGLCFTPGRLRALRNKIPEIDELLWRQNLSRVSRMYKVEQEDVVYRAHLGAGVYVSVDRKFNGVDLRRHWVPERQEAVVPTKEGIYMSIPQ